jgi:hypothetical protein
VTIVNQNGESSKSTKRKTTDHQQEKIKEYEKNQETRKFLPKWAVGFQYSVKIRFLKAIAKPDEWLKNYSSRSESTCPIYFFLGAWVAQ